MAEDTSQPPQLHARFTRIGQALPDEARQRLEQIGSADILVGIPSFNNAQTIGHVVTTAATGMRRYFPDLRAVLVNADGGSSDGTKDVVRHAPVPEGVEVLSAAYRGLPGKGTAFRMVFEAVAMLGARVCVVVDSDLRSITPEWIDLLAGPVLREGQGYVAPYYARHKYDGTITNNIAYPMTSALYGTRVRQPIGGDFGFDGALARVYLDQDVWQTEVARFGIDIFMTTTALAEGYPVAQANLGAKVHDPKDPASSLGPMFQQVVGTLFALMERYESHWREVAGARPARRFGPPLAVEPEPVNVDLQALVDKFRQGFKDHLALLGHVLSPTSFEAISMLAHQDDGGFQFPSESWARTCYDFAAAHHLRVAPATELIGALTPLYFGRTAGLVQETREMDTDTFESYIEGQAHVFEALKPYLLERWGT